MVEPSIELMVIKLFELLILMVFVVHQLVLLLVDELEELDGWFTVEVLKTVLDKALTLQVGWWPVFHV
jgi:hypothetical protein